MVRGARDVEADTNTVSFQQKRGRLELRPVRGSHICRRRDEDAHRGEQRHAEPEYAPGLSKHQPAGPQRRTADQRQEDRSQGIGGDGVRRHQHDLDGEQHRQKRGLRQETPAGGQALHTTARVEVTERDPEQNNRQHGPEGQQQRGHQKARSRRQQDLPRHHGNGVVGRKRSLVVPNPQDCRTEEGDEPENADAGCDEAEHLHQGRLRGLDAVLGHHVKISRRPS